MPFPDFSGERKHQAADGLLLMSPTVQLVASGRGQSPWPGPEASKYTSASHDHLFFQTLQFHRPFNLKSGVKTLSLAKGRSRRSHARLPGHVRGHTGP